MWKRRLPTLWVVAVVLTAGAAVWLLATDRLPLLSEGNSKPIVASVPVGDVEMAWLHTSTNGTTWERFVTGLMELNGDGLIVSDEQAFSDSTTSVPELVIRSASHEGALRIRWYKLTGTRDAKQWIEALSLRNPPPIAFVGGGTSDRAKELANELRKISAGGNAEAPLLFLTTATEDGLTKIYEGRTFRFCFNNTQMAEAVVSYADSIEQADRRAVHSLGVVWRDDPFSLNLHDRFDAVIDPKTAYRSFAVRSSIGGAIKPNADEEAAVQGIVEDCRRHPDQRIQLILPTVTQPARRILRGVLQREPILRDRLTVLTGDGIPGNALLRDQPFAWPVADLPVPLILFTHNNPFGWTSRLGPAAANVLPSTTEDVLHFKDLGRVLTRFAFPPKDSEPEAPTWRSAFNKDGDRMGGAGEYVIHLRPNPSGTVLVAARREARAWIETATVDLAGNAVAAARRQP